MLCLGALASTIMSQNFWEPLSSLRGSKYTTSDPIQLNLNEKALWQYVNSNAETFELTVPLFDGSTRQFIFRKTQTLSPQLSAKYPNIKTYSAYEYPISVHIEITPESFHGIIFSPQGTQLIEPNEEGSTEYEVGFQTAWVEKHERYYCHQHQDPINSLSFEADRVNAVKLRDGQASEVIKYRVAIATTTEFSASKGNTKESVLSAVTTIINRVNAILIRDFAIRLEIVPDNDKILFINTNDPFSNGNPESMLNQITSVLNDEIKITNYDIGHVLGTNSGGIATQGVVCTINKAKGVSGTFGIYRGALFYLIVAHEIGHQLNASHTFNFCDNQNETSATAFEPGSGSTIMAYAGASDCGANYVQESNDPYFHNVTINQVLSYTRNGPGKNCAQIIPIENIAPVANILKTNFTHIPISTPFKLEGEGFDPDGDTLTYTWEEYDLGPLSPLGNPKGDAPSFRSLPPNLDPIRYFPDYDNYLSDKSDINEVLPTYSRNLKFRLTVRDNHWNGGLTDWDQIDFKADQTAGPFQIINPNGSEIIVPGLYEKVTWDVANTDNGNVGCKLVNIWLSLDGGQTWPIQLAEKTDNDGSEYLIFPDVETNVARIMIEAADNIFYTVSESLFSIKKSQNPKVSLALFPNSDQICLPNQISFEIISQQINGFDEEIQLDLTSVLPEGTDINFSKTTIGNNDTVNLQLSFPRMNESSDLELIITGISNSENFELSAKVQLIPSDFTDLKLIDPVDGQTNVSILPKLSWTSIKDATYYQLELAKNPSFDTVISANNVFTNTYKPIFSLDENTVYYWRIKAINSCAEGPFSQTFAFQTKTVSCATYESEDTPTTGTRKVESEIMVPTDVPILDVNIPNMKGLFEFVGNLDAKLIHSTGTIITLFKNRCANLSNFNLGFDDDSQIEVSCPLTSENIFKPEDSLAIFMNLSSAGNWTLQINDNGGTTGGSITSWSLEICTNLLLNAPHLVLHDTLDVEQSGTELTNHSLQISDEDTQPSDLTFTIVKLPEYVDVFYQGILLKTGDTFSQQDIDNGNIIFFARVEEQTLDSILITVEDGSGGWIPTFPLYLVTQVETSGIEFVHHNFWSIYPNPTVNRVYLKGDYSGLLFVEIYAPDGKMILRTNLNFHQENAIRLNNLSAGLYYIKMTSSLGIQTKKLFISKTD